MSRCLIYVKIRVDPYKLFDRRIRMCEVCKTIKVLRANMIVTDGDIIDDLQTASAIRHGMPENKKETNILNNQKEK